MKQLVLQSTVFYPSGMPLKRQKYTEHESIWSNKTKPTYAVWWTSKPLTIKLIKLLWYDVALRNKIKMFHTLKKKKENNINTNNKFMFWLARQP